MLQYVRNKHTYHRQNETKTVQRSFNIKDAKKETHPVCFKFIELYHSTCRHDYCNLKPEMQPVRFFLDRVGTRPNSAWSDRTGQSTGMSHQEIFSLKLSHNFYRIIPMTSQYSADEQGTLLTCVHLNT